MSLRFKLENIYPGDFLIKALDGDTIIGTYAFTVEDYKPDNKLVTGSVFVPQRFRGQGIGPRLVFRFGAEISEMAEKNKTNYVHVVTFETPESERRLSPLYFSFGYIPFTTRYGRKNAVREYIHS